MPTNNHRMPLMTFHSDVVPKPLFPTMDSLQEVVNMASTHIPVTHRNQLISILGVYHNTLLKQLKGN